LQVLELRTIPIFCGESAYRPGTYIFSDLERMNAGRSCVWPPRGVSNNLPLQPRCRGGGTISPRRAMGPVMNCCAISRSNGIKRFRRIPRRRRPGSHRAIPVFISPRARSRTPRLERAPDRFAKKRWSQSLARSSPQKGISACEGVLDRGIPPPEPLEPFALPRRLNTFPNRK